MKDRLSLAHWVILLAFAGYALIPVYLVLLASVRSETDLFASPLALPWPVSLGQYRELWVQSGFGRFFLNSFVISGSVTLIIAVVAPPAGFAFAKLNFKGREVLFGLLLLGLAMPAPAVIVGLYGNLQSVGLLDSQLGVILPQVAILLPFSVFLMRTVVQEVPNELLEASLVDGASTFEMFWYVTMPMVMPGFRSLLLIVFLFAWQEFLLPLVVLQTETLKPLTVGAATFQGRYGVNYSGIAAAGVITFLPLVALFLMLQRSFVQGLTAGAVK